MRYGRVYDDKMRRKFTLLALVLLGVVLAAHPLDITGAQEIRQASYSLRNFDVQVSYPLQAEPGKSVVVSVHATAKATVYVVDLRMQIMYYSTGGSLIPLISDSLASNVRVNKGNLLQRDLTVTIPSDLPRGELVGFVSERVRYTVNYYSYYYGWPYYYYNHSYYYYYDYPYYPYYSTSSSYESTDAGILPLTYVLSTTPEYVALKSQYDDLNSRYNALSAEFEELKSDHQLTLDQLNQMTQLQEATALDLGAARNTINQLTVVAVILGVATAAFFGLYMRERRRSPPAKETVKPPE